MGKTHPCMPIPYAILFPMRRKNSWGKNLEMYAFWTGFISTIISLIQVIVIALK